MNAKPLIALVAFVASAGAFAQQGVAQAQRDFYVFEASPAVGKTRAEVLAELAEARRTGELERIRSDYYGYETPTQPMVRMAKRNGAKAQ